MAVKSGQEILARLVKSSDVLVENFKLGTLEKWGITNDWLEKNKCANIYDRLHDRGRHGHLTVGYRETALGPGGPHLSIGGRQGTKSGGETG